ncbi:MAG: hypothetical protein M3P49_13870 [Actinomycetota bacterium]|nr:hypothetical protein [Actinomycetota bacterium]
MPDLVMDVEFGTAYGFVGLEELGRYRLDQIENGVNVVRDAVQRTLAFNNAKNEAFRGTLSVDVEVAKELYEMPSGGTLQDIDEHDNPLPTVQQAAQDVAFPIRGGGDATGNDRVSRALMTVADANRAVLQAQMRDKRWHINYMMAAIFRSTEYPFLDRGRRLLKGAGRLVIKPLANGDADQYMTNGGAGVGPDNHYLAHEGGITAAANPIPRIYTELVEHQENPGQVDVYVPQGLVASIEGLPNFREPRDPNVQYGSGESTVAEGNKGIGDRYVGYVDGCHIIQMNALPAGYIFAQARGARPLGYRQFPAAALRGLFQETHSPDGNHLETRFLRYGGYACRNRVAALCMQVGVAAGAAYAAPVLPMRLS